MFNLLLIAITLCIGEGTADATTLSKEMAVE